MSHHSPAAGDAAIETTAATADRRAADAVVAHHAQLAGALRDRVEQVLDNAERGDAGEVWRARADLLEWLNAELLPHALAEESALYPAAARGAGALLVEGMLDEHRTILGLVDELAAATTPTRAGAAARALTAVFGTHLAKENDLILPLLLGSGDVSLAEVLEGMHDLLGDHAEAGGAPAGSGCGGACGCGGDSAGAGAAAPALSIDPRLDVREIPHDRRHATVLAALDAVPAGGALVLVAPHAPRPLLAEIAERHPGRFELEWLQDGPTVWQVRLSRAAALV